MIGETPFVEETLLRLVEIEEVLNAVETELMYARSLVHDLVDVVEEQNYELGRLKGD